MGKQSTLCEGPSRKPDPTANANLAAEAISRHPTGRKDAAASGAIPARLAMRERHSTCRAGLHGEVDSRAHLVSLVFHIHRTTGTRTGTLVPRAPWGLCDVMLSCCVYLLSMTRVRWCWLVLVIARPCVVW